MKPQEKREQTIQNLIDTVSLKEPKKVPVCSDIYGWAFGYAGVKYGDIIDDPQAVADAYCKVFEEIPMDMCLDTGFSPVAFKPQRDLGMKAYNLSADGTTIVHEQANAQYFGPEIYDEIIDNATDFMGETYYRRAIPAFQGSKAEALAALRRAYWDQKNIEQAKEETRRRLTEELGLYGLQDETTVAFYAPFNNFFDYYRGIKNALTDLRRYPDKVRAACDAIWESQDWARAYDEQEIKQPLPVASTIYHSECFMSPKQFDDYFWRYLIEGYLPVLEAGKKLFLFGEGSFLNTLDRYLQLPKGSCIIQLDDDDPYEAYKIIGNYHTIVCGVKTDTLQLGTVEQCRDEVKRAFDTFAPGGGFIFSPNKELVSGKDAKIENVVAVYELADELSRQ